MLPLYSFPLRQSFLLSISSHDADGENPSFIHLSRSSASHSITSSEYPYLMVILPLTLTYKTLIYSYCFLQVVVKALI